MTCSLFLSRKIPVGELGCPSDTSAPCYSPSQALPQLEIVYQISTFCWTQPGLLFNPPALTSATLWGKKKKRLSLLSCPLRHFDLTLWNVLGKQKQALDLHPRSEWKTSVLSYCQKSLAPQLADSSPGQPLTFTTYWGHVQREWISANHRIANPGSEVFLNPAHNLIINPDPNCSLTQT